MQLILLQQLEDLSNENLKGEDLKIEIKRAEAMAKIGQTLVNSAKAEVAACKVTDGVYDIGFVPNKGIE